MAETAWDRSRRMAAWARGEAWAHEPEPQTVFVVTSNEIEYDVFMGVHRTREKAEEQVLEARKKRLEGQIKFRQRDCKHNRKLATLDAMRWLWGMSSAFEWPTLERVPNYWEIEEHVI